MTNIAESAGSDPLYRRASLETEQRVSDLLSRMTLAEKAGLMFHAPVLAAFGPDTSEPAVALSEIARMIDSGMNHFQLRGSISGTIAPRALAEWHNAVQTLAAATRLGIPVTFSSDPRHGLDSRPGISALTGYFSKWPEPVALAATRDPALVEEFGDTVRQEYRAVGIHVALHPQADLATEPRWMRINGTFGQDAALASTLVAAYIRGVQGAVLGPRSVACMTKHFPGGGPQKDGEDPHFPYGKDQVYPGRNFDYHVRPFRAAIAAGTSQIMPYYGRPVGTYLEEVGFNFNRQVVHDLLRTELGFEGIVCTDWGILTDNYDVEGFYLEAMAWGVEELSVQDRALKALHAGVDQFGGEECPDLVVRLCEEGRLSTARIDASVRRLLREKFVLGLFDDPYVDPEEADAICGRADFVRKGFRAQRRSITVLKNAQGSDGAPVLPLKATARCHIVNFDPELAAIYCSVVSADEADVTLLSLSAPFEARDGAFERMHHAGRLNFADQDLDEVLGILAARPTVVAINLDRPAVIPEVVRASAALLSFCGASDAALLDIIFGRAKPQGLLPFDMPASMDEVVRHHSDVAGGTVGPLFTFGDGMQI